jgi:hypothetical protein
MQIIESATRAYERVFFIASFHFRQCSFGRCRHFASEKLLPKTQGEKRSREQRIDPDLATPLATASRFLLFFMSANRLPISTGNLSDGQPGGLWSTTLDSQSIRKI